MPQTTRCRHRLSALLTVKHGTSGGCEDADTAEAQRVPDCRYKYAILREVNEGTVEMVVSDVSASASSWGQGCS